jgi:hypothetical protein
MFVQFFKGVPWRRLINKVIFLHDLMVLKINYICPHRSYYGFAANGPVVQCVLGYLPGGFYVGDPFPNISGIFQVKNGMRNYGVNSKCMPTLEKEDRNK